MTPEELIEYSKIQGLKKNEKYRISWDIADRGQNWVVQFWHINNEGRASLITFLDRGSGECGSFDLYGLSPDLKAKYLKEGYESCLREVKARVGSVRDSEDGTQSYLQGFNDCLDEIKKLIENI